MGILFNQDHEVLVGQRTVQDQYFEKWEFPGGKLETGEQPDQALVRELSEELNIDVRQSESLLQVQHDYPDRKVALHVFEVTDYQGEPIGREGQALKWQALNQLSKLDFLAGNQVIVEHLLSRSADTS